MGCAARTLLRPAPGSPLNTTIGTPRRYTTAGTRLDDYQRVRQAHGVTINDVVLATVSGALRGWLHQRGEPVPPTASLRAMVPVNVGTEQRADPPGKNVSAYVVELPIGEPDPLRRLGEVCDRLQRHNNAGPSGPTDALITLASLVPPPLHARGARLVGELSRRLFNVVVSNVPGPQIPLYVAGARMLTLHPVVPLAPGQAVSIGLICLRRRRLLRPQRRPRQHARPRPTRRTHRRIAARAGRRTPRAPSPPARTAGRPGRDGAGQAPGPGRPRLA